MISPSDNMDKFERRVLLVVHTNSYFTGLLPLAKTLIRDGKFEPFFLFTRYYPTLPDDLETCRVESISAMQGKNVKRVMDFNLHLLDMKSDLIKKLPNRVKKYLNFLRFPNFLIGEIVSRILDGSILGEIISLTRVIAEIRNIIRKEKLSLIILPADNRYDQSAYIKAAHLENIGSVIVPQFMASSLEWAEYVFDQPAYHGGKFLNRLASRLYPRWSFVYKNRKLVALPGAQILAREWLQLAPPLPWILHSGHADAVALESEAVLNYCLAEGLPAEKLFATGSVSLDALFNVQSNFQHQKNELCKSLGIQNDRPIILSALPPDSLYMGRPECDFQIYADLVEFWCRSISSVPGYHHIVALHPSVRYEEMKYIESFGLKIARVPTMNVVPLCEFFVASISSTIQWAIACGKPVLNYDVFRYRYTDYQKVDGVITVEEQSDFLRILEQFTSDSNFFPSVVSKQARFTEQWGRLDGKAGDRLQKLFSLIIERYVVS